MNTELQTVEGCVNFVIGKPVSWLIYAILVAVRFLCRRLVIAWKWARQKYQTWKHGPEPVVVGIRDEKEDWHLARSA